jgi:hypothetical protein
MIKKLLVVITLATVVIACGDKKKDNTDASNYVSVANLVENADSLLNLAEVTLVGKLEGVCPVSGNLLVKGANGAFVQLVLAEGVSVDSLLFGGAVAVTGKLSATVLDSDAIAELEAKAAEAKEACAAAKEEKTCEKAEAKEEKACCAKKEGKSCCSAPKAGDSVYTLTAAKVEKFECPNAEKCCKASEEAAATEEQPAEQ